MITRETCTSVKLSLISSTDWVERSTRNTFYSKKNLLFWTKYVVSVSISEEKGCYFVVTGRVARLTVARILGEIAVRKDGAKFTESNFFASNLSKNVGWIGLLPS